MIPIELVIFTEIAKFIGKFYMESDVLMMEADYNTDEIKATKCHTYNLHEELGTLDYLFSDKTGTLTKNSLVFRGLSIVNKNQTSFVAEGSIDEIRDTILAEGEGWY